MYTRPSVKLSYETQLPATLTEKNRWHGKRSLALLPEAGHVDAGVFIGVFLAFFAVVGLCEDQSQGAFGPTRLVVDFQFVEVGEELHAEEILLAASLADLGGVDQDHRADAVLQKTLDDAVGMRMIDFFEQSFRRPMSGTIISSVERRLGWRI